MGIKITELTSAGKVVGNELTPLVQSTETRQTAVSSVYTALTSQIFEQYVCEMTKGGQGSLAYFGAGGGVVDLGVTSSDSVCFAGLTAGAIDDAYMAGDLIITDPNKLCARGEVCVVGDTNMGGGLFTRDAVTLGNQAYHTLSIASSAIAVCGLPAATGNTVVIRDSSKNLGRDEIDGKVWQAKLVDYCGVLTRCAIPKFIDTDGTIQNSIITDCGDEGLVVSGSLSATGNLSAVKVEADDLVISNTVSVSNLSSSGNLSATEVSVSDIVISDKIVFEVEPPGDMNRITFENGQMDFYAGNDNPAIQLEPDKVIINEDGDSTIDFCVRSAVVGCPALYADGGTGNVGINCSTPTEQLTVRGDVSIYCGDLNAWGNTCTASLSSTNITGIGTLILKNLPTSDPAIAGAVYYCPTDRILRISCCT